MTDIVINVSTPHYNLGAAKIVNWLRAQGQTFVSFNGDPGLAMPSNVECVWLSVIFSWHAPIAAQIALRMKSHAEVFCGGPGMFALGKWWKQETGLVAQRGLDARFERQRGDYEMTFASRGCPVDCSFCIVPRLEGTEFTLDWDFDPAPILCDNNVSALPAEFQNHIIATYRRSGVMLRDCNSGFEPRTFDETTFDRWRPVLNQSDASWRFAFDTTSEAADVERMMKILKPVRARRKRVYVLIGNEPIEQCFARAMKVIEWGGEPYCQPVMPLNALSRKQYKVVYDWTSTLLQDFARYFNRYVWRKHPLWSYSNRQGEAPPFAWLQPQKAW